MRSDWQGYSGWYKATAIQRIAVLTSAVEATNARSLRPSSMSQPWPLPTESSPDASLSPKWSTSNRTAIYASGLDLGSTGDTTEIVSCANTEIAFQINALEMATKIINRGRNINLAQSVVHLTLLEAGQCF